MKFDVRQHVWDGAQFLEFFVSHLKQHPTCQVHISTFLIQYQRSGVLYDLYNELNRRPACIFVGTTRYVSQGSIEKEIKRIRKTWPNLNIRLVYNDHRKIFLCTYKRYNGAVHLGLSYRAWLGSQNLYDSSTKNCMLEAPQEAIPQLRAELADLT